MVTRVSYSGLHTANGSAVSPTSIDELETALQDSIARDERVLMAVETSHRHGELIST